MEMDRSHISLDDGAWLAVGDWLGVGEGCAGIDGPELGDDDGGAVGPSLGAVLVVGRNESCCSRGRLRCLWCKVNKEIKT